MPKSPEQLDWLREEDKKHDEDEHSRLRVAYGEEAGQAPLTEKERKEKQQKIRSERKAGLKELINKLREPFPKQG